MNTTINVYTGFTLFYILYGTKVALPIDHALMAPPMSVATSHVAIIKQIVQEAYAAMARHNRLRRSTTIATILLWSIKLEALSS